MDWQYRKCIGILIEFCFQNRITVVFGATTPKVNGSYNRFSKTIELSWSLKPEKQYHVFLHELGHWYLWDFQQRHHTENEADLAGNHIAKLQQVPLNPTVEGNWIWKPADKHI